MWNRGPGLIININHVITSRVAAYAKGAHLTQTRKSRPRLPNALRWQIKYHARCPSHLSSVFYPPTPSKGPHPDFPLSLRDIPLLLPSFIFIATLGIKNSGYPFSSSLHHRRNPHCRLGSLGPFEIHTSRCLSIREVRTGCSQYVTRRPRGE